jgi:hypothetical protein
MVIAGEFGPKMADALQRKNIGFQAATGTAADAVRTAIKQ